MRTITITGYATSKTKITLNLNVLPDGISQFKTALIALSSLYPGAEDDMLDDLEALVKAGRQICVAR